MTYIQIKPGVDMSGLRREIWRKAHDIADVFDSYNYECVITSAFRPEKPHSLHHGYALDFRAKHIRSEAERLTILSELIGACGPDYDVILHGEGGNIHYHVEYDPE